MKKKLKTSIEFINHASVLISSDDISILSDPWYEGNAFNKGWDLLHQTNDLEAEKILDRTTHIWLSHEHPDHFSVIFFKKFKSKIIDRSIKILFQETVDKRVINFLKKQSFKCTELKFNKDINLTKTFSVKCIKDGFYDSGLLIKSNNEKILNLNDCEVNTPSRISEIKSIVGEVDVLLTQFSFAAWKGGKKNTKWRKLAASEKLKTIKLQTENFKPNYIIPFASFIYFSNYENSYLNDAANKPLDVQEVLKNTSVEVIIMKPNDILGGEFENISINSAINFWNEKYQSIYQKKLNSFKSVSIEELFSNFRIYCNRISKKNNLWLMKVLKIISPIPILRPVIIKIIDLEFNVKFDYISKKLFKTSEEAHISMSSESLNFLFKNSFGFDTLTVNGCFEENKKKGFIISTKTLAIENLNNLGFYISIKTIFNINLLSLFFKRLYSVKKKINY